MAISGNLAKYQIVLELENLLTSEPDRNFRILDVGITGPKPLTFWRPLFKFENFELTGVDVDAESIERLKKEELPTQVKELMSVSGYDLANEFGENAFDIVVSTQVLEHMRYPEKFLMASADILKDRGVFYISYDNGDFPRGHDPVRDILKDVVVRVTGNERYHDKDIPSEEVREMLERVGFGIDSQRFYNLDPLKKIQNHELSEKKKAEFLVMWKSLEDWLNDNGHADTHSDRYQCVFFKAVKK